MNTPTICNMAKRHSGGIAVDNVTGSMGHYAHKVVISALHDNNSLVNQKLQDKDYNVDVMSQCSGFSYEEKLADEAVRIKDDSFKQLSLEDKCKMWLNTTTKLLEGINLKRETAENLSPTEIVLHSVLMEGAQETEALPLINPGKDTRSVQTETDLHCDSEHCHPVPDSERFTLSKAIDLRGNMQISQNGPNNKDVAILRENDALETPSTVVRKSTNRTETTAGDLHISKQVSENITHGTQSRHMSDTKTCLEKTESYICDHAMLMTRSLNTKELASRQFPKEITFEGNVQEAHPKTWLKGLLKSEDMCVSDNAKSPVVDLQLTEKQTSSIRFAESVIDGYSESRFIPSSESSQLCVSPVYGLPVSINSDMHSEMSRLATFSTAPTLAVSTIRLANSGFYYEEESDNIVCFSCGLEKREWREKENVHLVHFDLSQRCDHAKKLILQQNNTSSTVNGQPAHTQSSSADGAHTMTTDGESTDTRGSMAQRSASHSWSETARQRFQSDHEDDSFNTGSDMTRMHENHLLLAGSRQPPQENSVAAEYRNNFVTTNGISVINGEPQLQTDCFQNGASLSSIGPSAKNDTPSLHNSFANGDSVEEGETQRRQSAAKTTEQTRSRNNSTHMSQNRNSSSFALMPNRNAVSSSTGSPLDGKSLALPTPAGRAEQLQRHRQLAAQSAGTARHDGLDSSYPFLNGKSITNPIAGRQSDKKQIGVHNTETAHTGTCSDVPMLDHFNPSVQAHLSVVSLQSPTAVPATTLVNYSVQVVQAPDANPFQRGSSNALRQNEDGAGEVPGDALLDMRRAASPDNALVSVRLATFLDWPTRGLPNRRLLVIAGFYYMGTGDSVRCFYCGVTLRNWRENDDPWVTHVRFRFSCDYVKAIKGEDFVYRALLQVALGHAISSETGCITSSESAAVTNGIDNSSTSCSSQQTSPTSITNTTSAYAANSNAASDNAAAASGTTVPSTAARSSTTVGMSKEAPRGPGSCSTTEQTSENSASRSDMNAEGNRDQATLRSRDASEGASTSSTENGPDAMGTGKKGKGNNKGGASKTAANTDGASVGTYAQNGVEVLQTDAEPDKHRSTASLPQTNQQTVAVGGQSLTIQSTVSMEYPNAGVAGNHGDATSFQQLQETNHRLRRRVTCRLCGNRPVDTIFLPCGHLCTCETCAATIRMCCLCNDRIRGTAHVYME